MDENEQDFDLDNEDELNDSEESGAAEGGEGAPPEEGNDGSESESKRIADLMSKWQKAEARAKKAEAALNKSGGQTKGKSKQSDTLSEFEEFAREDARQRLFNSDPRFAKYGISADSISGATFAEMRTSFETQKRLVDSLESRIRNEVLAEHGLAPEVGGSASQKGLPDFGSMSDEDFDKLLERRRL